MSPDPRHDPAVYPLVGALPLRYNDADQQGHLNNVAIAALYQEARVALLQHALGPRVAEFRIVLVEQTIRFLAEGAYPAETVVGSGVSGLGTSSYRLAHALFQGGRCIGLCDSVLVNVGGDGRPQPLSPEDRSALSALQLRTES